MAIRPASPAQTLALKDWLRAIASDASAADDERPGHSQPADRGINRLKIGVYVLVRRYRARGQLQRLSRFVGLRRRDDSRRPAIEEQPFLWGVLAIDQFYPLPRHTRRLISYQLYAADKAHVPPALLPGFLWQYGVELPEEEAGKKYWQQRLRSLAEWKKRADYPGASALYATRALRIVERSDLAASDDEVEEWLEEDNEEDDEKGRLDDHKGLLSASLSLGDWVDEIARRHRPRTS